MSRIVADHLAREAIVYVRQSTMDQVINNVESRRRQYGLVERARQLGWADVSVIDDDLGRSGSGVSRPGFEKLLAAICEGRVGAVVSIEASRLARNGRDWHTLLEFCGLVGTLIVDEDGVYDPRLANDRLLLGMKGTMSEMELSILRQRAHEALKQKARRGELFTSVAVGYVRSGSDRIEQDPDLRVRKALALVFRKFSKMQSVRQVHLWLRQEGIPLPAVCHGPEGRRVQWKAPVYNTIHHILTNPIYAGAYAYGRSISKTRIENGRKRVARGFRVDRPEWDVLIRDHHAGYIGWDAFERNQRLIKDNANGKSWASRGAVRRGEALLAGLFRCGHCSRKLHVAYGGTKGDVARYHCRGALLNHGTARCISFGSLRVDAAVAAEVIARIQPLGVEAALAAVEARGSEDAEKRRQVELALEQARFEVRHARRQYDAVDPDNRLVAGELERRWNERLKEERRLQDELDALGAAPSSGIAPDEREALLRLGADVERAWHAEGATIATRKRIVRMLIEEIVVRVEDAGLDLVIRWVGDDHTALRVRKNRTGEHRWIVDADIVALVRAMARQMPDMGIAAAFNRAGMTTAKGNSWTRSKVASLRKNHGVAVYREGERPARGEATLDEAAHLLAVSPSTVRRLIVENVLPASQACKGAPWIIRLDDLRRADIAQAADRRRQPSSKRPSSQDEQTLSLNFQ
ncbi:MAG TPA: recombinase family protein [Roseiarcus sp.]|jgi:DNA invertase Pin-like site-specific DNA recombinase|nr:recombinase family protein [Roseiarcus sp.]